MHKFAECDNIFLQNFSLNSIAYIYLLVKFLFCLFFCFFHVYFLPVMVNKDVYLHVPCQNIKICVIGGSKLTFSSLERHCVLSKEKPYVPLNRLFRL